MPDGDGREDLVWPRERSESVGDFRHFRVRRDWNRSPETGELRDFYVLEMPDWVQVVPVTVDGRVVMVEQFRPGTRSMTLEFPAGLVSDRETPVESAVRELEEETGYRGERPRIIGEVLPNPALQDNRLFIVLVEECRPTGRRSPDPGEVIRPREVAMDDAGGMTKDGLVRDAYGVVAWEKYLEFCRAAAS